MGTAKSRPGSLFDTSDFCQIVNLIFLDVVWNVLHRYMRRAELAFDVTETFCMEMWEHERILEFYPVFDAFALEVLHFLPYFILNSAI